LAHYHSRGFDLYRDKSYKIVKGRGMNVNDVAHLENILRRDQNALGAHHIRRVIADRKGQLRDEWKRQNSAPVTTSSSSIWDFIKNETRLVATSMSPVETQFAIPTEDPQTINTTDTETPEIFITAPDEDEPKEEVKTRHVAFAEDS
jgi:hypothetical protein